MTMHFAANSHLEVFAHGIDVENLMVPLVAVETVHLKHRGLVLH